MLLLGVDLETTGLDTESCKIIELGMCLWDSDRNIPVKIVSDLVSITDDLSDEITLLTGITNDDLSRWGIGSKEMILKFQREATMCDMIVGHNVKGFDKKILTRYLEYYDLDIGEKPWLDTLVDFEDQYTEKGFKSKSLDYLGAMHGVRNMYSSSHRAINDVLDMFEVIKNYDLDQAIKNSQIVKYEIQCKVAFDDKDKLKEFGVRRWNTATKCWGGIVSGEELVQIQTTIPSFKIVKQERL